MRQRLLALVATMSAAGLGAGALVFVRWNEPHTIERTVLDVDGWRLVDADSCVPRACSTAKCVTAQNHLTDAGTGCVVRLVACDWRVTPRLRALASDAGVALGPQLYQRIEVGALRCPGADGGFAWSVPLDDAGWPVAADVAGVTPRCVRALRDGGSPACLRVLPDGGTRYFGHGNVFPVGEASGVGCEPCACVRMAGDEDGDL